MKQEIVIRRYVKLSRRRDGRDGGKAILGLACHHLKVTPLSREPKKSVWCEECEGAEAFKQGKRVWKDNPYNECRTMYETTRCVAWYSGFKAAQKRRGAVAAK
jgi:hypothetical protein